MGFMRYAPFTETGESHSHVKRVSAGDKVAEFSAFRTYIAVDENIKDEDKDFHIHFQNTGPCNGSGDIDVALWRRLVRSQQESEVDFDVIYYFHFVSKIKPEPSPMTIHDSKSFHTAQPEVRFQPVSLDSLPSGSSFEPFRRSVSSTTMVETPCPEPSISLLQRKRPNQFSLRERVVKNLRREGNGGTRVHSESSDAQTQDLADIDRMVNAAEVENRAAPNNNNNNDDCEDRAIRDTQLHDGRVPKYQAGVLENRPEVAVFVLAERKRLRHLIRKDCTQGNALGWKGKMVQVKARKVTYRGVFEKYQDDRPGLHKKLFSLRSEDEENDRSEYRQDTEDDSASESDHSAEPHHEERPQMVSEVSPQNLEGDGYALSPPPIMHALPIRTPRWEQDSEDDGEQLGAPPVKVHLTFLRFDDLSTVIRRQELDFPITATIQDVLTAAKRILCDNTSLHNLHIKRVNIVNAKPSISMTEVWEKRRNLEYYLQRDYRGHIVYELDVETIWTWTDDPSHRGSDGGV